MKRLIILLVLLSSGSLLASDYQVGDHELFLMPTAYTMPKGSAYFTDYELFFLNYTRALTPTTHVGVFSLFPVTTHFLKTLTLGIKQQYFSSPTFKSAVWANYTPKVSGFMLGNVLSIGRHGSHLHLALSGATTNDVEDWEFVYMLGVDMKTSNRLSVMAEYTNTSSLVEDDFRGLLSLGVRFRSTKMAWELAGIRPIQSSGEFLFFPFLKGTLYFE